MEVEPQAQAPQAKPTATNAAPEHKDSNPPGRTSTIPERQGGDNKLETAYSPAGSAAGRAPSASEDASTYCIRCGASVPQNEDTCPDCGYPIQELLDGMRPDRRWRPRRLQPVWGFLAIAGAILIPLGLVFFAAGPIVSEGFRRPGSPPFVVGVLFWVLAGLTELTAQVCCLIWLYQAWRVVLHGDEEFSAGLMVGLLFIPFFNFYWMFRAIPGLSLAIQQELKYLAPTRAHSTGWVPGMIACILALIPYLQPIALCMFLGWMLIANNAVNRLIRFHERWHGEGSSQAGNDE
jgi:hypothetical protein